MPGEEFAGGEEPQIVRDAPSTHLVCQEVSAVERQADRCACCEGGTDHMLILGRERDR
jgi:hypothetical protein